MEEGAANRVGELGGRKGGDLDGRLDCLDGDLLGEGRGEWNTTCLLGTGVFPWLELRTGGSVEGDLVRVCLWTLGQTFDELNIKKESPPVCLLAWSKPSRLLSSQNLNGSSPFFPSSESPKKKLILFFSVRNNSIKAAHFLYTHWSAN